MNTPALAARAPRSLAIPLLGALVAVAITAMMDVRGLSQFSALPLCPLMLLLWGFQRLPARSLGFHRGRLEHYGLAVLYPLVVMGTLTSIAWAAGELHPEGADWAKALANLALVSISTVLVAIVTEEGFFRGWFWASLERVGLSSQGILIATSIAFALWHISSVTVKTSLGFELPPAQVPLFIVNAALMGMSWGLLRNRSGSILVSSVSHGIWNGLAYVLYGFGSKVGALGVQNTQLFGPEVGVLGLTANFVFVVVLWGWWSADSSGGRSSTDPVDLGEGREQSAHAP